MSVTPNLTQQKHVKQGVNECDAACAQCYMFIVDVVQLHKST